MPSEKEIEAIESFLRDKYLKGNNQPVDVNLFIWKYGVVESVPIEEILEVAEKARFDEITKGQAKRIDDNIDLYKRLAKR
jgi:hypothetical protein